MRTRQGARTVLLDQDDRILMIRHRYDGVIVVPRENADEVAGFARRFLDNIGKERYEQRLKAQ